MLKKITWLTCATLLCALLIALPAAQTALASSTGTDVAKIGEKTYETLQKAVDAVTDPTPTTITLLRDAAGDGVKVVSDRSITFDLAGHTYNIDGDTVGSTGTETNGFQLLRDSAVTFKNGKITSNKAIILIQNYSNLTLEDMVLDGSNLAGTGPYTLSLNNGTVNITGNTSILAKEDSVAFDVYYWPSSYPKGVQVTVNTTGTISGSIELGLSKDATSSGAAKNNKLIIQNINHEGRIKNDLGNYDTDVVTISGGTFSESPVRYTGDTVILSGGYYYVGKQANAVLSNPNTEEVTVLKAKGELKVADGIQLTNNTGRTITVNGNSIEDKGALLIHEWEEIPAKAPTCTEAGHAAYRKCHVCGLMLDLNGNALTTVPVIAATGHNYQNGVCTVCGAREDVPAVTPPKTGDSAHPLLWSVLLLAALLGGGLLCTGLRKRFR